MGKCPKCGKLVTWVNTMSADAKAGARTWRGVLYCCPFCSTVLGVQIDPVALKADIVDEVVKKLRGFS